MIRREGKPKRIETFADLIQYVQKIDLENTEALVLEDAKGNRYRFVKKETKPRQRRQQPHQMTIIEIIGNRRVEDVQD
jgi:hypothetical protein